MSHHHRWIMTPGGSRKRKEREAFYSYNCNPSATAQPPATKAAAAALPVCSNRLLAGYMAYEFLTKGTLFGQKYDPARAGMVPLAGVASAELRRVKPEATEPSPKKEHQSYAEVANILKSKEAHIPGIVNPTQLARWVQM
ncbi:hypothetical protein SLEP1_g343 [Rubroshorea leprosula]|uniref:Embryo sac development arrest 6 n=1 Tax=Rubroshorea leprosula TaxID=152421 RepID=A0AAV5HA33_9ROSI|nr:hypothetical protein SLEP1_g343 [Rubroshorea leprosula]